jgi:homoserine O-acetyltransferase
VKRAGTLNAFSCYRLTQAADTHAVGRNREGIPAALAEIQAKTLLVGISSDQLFPPAEQRFLADKIPGAIYREIHSDLGHEAWRNESSRLKHLLKIFLEGDAENLAVEVPVLRDRSA